MLRAICYGALLWGIAASANGKPEEKCNPLSFTKIARSSVYDKYPFGAHESAKYTLYYGKIHVGHGVLTVKPPVRHKVASSKGKVNLWLMQFSGDAETGEWYENIFKGHDSIQAWSNPTDFSISKFYIRQKEKAALNDMVHKEKWLDFNHSNCQVKVLEKDHGKGKEKREEFWLQQKAIDVLGALYKLRTYDFQINKEEKFLVYSSEKNWELSVTPELIEEVETPAGRFTADKLRLRTYIGKELQQRGDAFIWIARGKEHPFRPMVKLEAEVSFGSIYLELEEFKPKKS